NRRRLGLPEETEHTSEGQRNLDEPPRWHSRPLPPSTGQDTPIAPNGPIQPAAASPAAASPAAASPAAASPATASPAAVGPVSVGPDADGDEPYVRIIPARPKTEQRTD